MKTIETIKTALKPIKDKAQYQEYLTLIDSLIDCAEDSPEEETLELISILVEEYEGKIFFD